MKVFWPSFWGCCIGTLVGGGLLLGGITYVEKSKHLSSPHVYPEILEGKRNFELGEIVSRIMPDNNDKEGWDWDWQSDSSSEIVWQAGFADEGTRIGWLRVNILGKLTTVLRESTREAGWNIILKDGVKSALWGPQSMTLSPADCGGAAYTGCDFDPFPSLDAQDIHHEWQCSSFDGVTAYHTYVLHHVGKENVVMTFQHRGDIADASDTLVFEEGGEEIADKSCIRRNWQLFGESDASDSNEEEVSSSLPYTKLIKEALSHEDFGKEAKGKKCEFYIVVNKEGIITEAEHNGDNDYNLLCEATLDKIKDINFPSISLNKNVIIPVNVSI